MNKRLLPFIILALVVVSGFFYFLFKKIEKEPEVDKRVVPKSSLADSFEVSNYKEGNQDPEIFISNACVNGYKIVLTTEKNCFFCLDSPLSQKLEIFKEGQLKYEVIAEGSKFFPFEDKTKEEEDFDEFLTAGYFVSRNLTDVNNNKIPELSFYQIQGSYYYFYIIELNEDELTVLFEDSNDFPAYFINEDNNELIEIEMYEDSIYLYTSHADMPAPRMILSYYEEIDNYTFDLEKMRKPAPSKEEIKKQANKCINGKEGDPLRNSFYCNSYEEYVNSLNYILDLIYTGNLKSAKEYIDLVWRDNEKWEKKEYFINELKENIEGSRYFKYLAPNLIDLSLL